MSLPEGYEISDFAIDPAGRRNHIFCAETDEVFHVDAEAFAAVSGVNPPPAKRKSAPKTRAAARTEERDPNAGE